MGTNYYYHPTGERKCSHCGQAAPTIHIGKSSFGWTFSFRGYRNPTDDEPPIASYAEWLSFLEPAPGRIFDEYGDPMSLQEFKDLVESKRGARNNHTVRCRTSHPEHAARDCWLDEEGNSFSDAEFS